MEYSQHVQVAAGNLVADFVSLNEDPAHLPLPKPRHPLTEARLAWNPSYSRHHGPHRAHGRASVNRLKELVYPL